MAAITPWTLGLEAIANGTAQPAPASRPAYKPAYTSNLTVAAQQAAKVEAKKQAVADAEAAEAATVADRHANLITNMYGGGEGSRVLSQEEINTGWTDALGRYHQPAFQDPRSEEELAAVRYRNLSHDWYKAGMDYFNPTNPVGERSFSSNAGAFGNQQTLDEVSQYLRGLYDRPLDQGMIMPWINTYELDREGTYNFIRDPDYNAFLGGRGGRSSSYDGYRDDSIAGWFKNAFAGQDQIMNRGNAIRDLNGWNWDGDGHGLNRATDVMTKQYFDQMDLANKYGLSWEQADALNNLTESGGGQGQATNSNLGAGNGMMSGGASSWLDVLNAGGNTNWNGMLGQYTKDKIDTNWAGMNTGQIQQKFGELFDSGMFSQDADRSLIYDKLMENLGRV